jgi:hypothetical protein
VIERMVQHLVAMAAVAMAANYDKFRYTAKGNSDLPIESDTSTITRKVV